MLANVARDCSQCATAMLVQIRHIEQSAFYENLPVLAKSKVAANHIQARVVVEKYRGLPVETDLTQAVGVLAADRDLRRYIVANIYRRNMALLDKFCCDILQCYLVARRNVVKVGVLDERIEAIVLNRAIRVADDSFRKPAFVKGPE